MATAAQRAIGFMCGGMTTTSVVILVTSFSPDDDIVATVLDPDTGATVTTGTLSAATLAAQKLGNDRGAPDIAGDLFFCYYGHITLSGLQPGTKYPVTLTQAPGGYAVGGPSSGRAAVTQTGQFITTLPGPTDDFRLYFGTCDKLHNTSGGDGEVGYYTHAIGHVTAGNLAYMLWIDDWGYADDFCYSAISDGLVTDKNSTGGSSFLQYNYAMCYGAMLGMLGDVAVPAILRSRQEDRLNFLLNVPYFMQWGDHEFADDLGWRSSIHPSFAAIYTAGSTAWRALFDPLRPPADIRSADLAANHWGVTIGPCRIAATDRITNSTGQWTTAPNLSQYPAEQFTAMYGADQISDILAALSGSEKFKILMNAYGEKYWCVGSFGGSGPGYFNLRSGQQHSLYHHQPTEYAQLYSGPGSLMDRATTNGQGYCFFSVHGDTHTPMVNKNYQEPTHYSAPPNATVKENWWSWWPNSWNGSNGNRLAQAALPVRNARPHIMEDGAEVVYYGGDDSDLGDVYTACFADVVQSAHNSPYLTMRITLGDSGTVAFSAIYTPTYGNQPWPGAYGDIPVPGGSWYTDSAQGDGIGNSTATETPSNNLICDRTGFKVSVKEGLRKEWTGRMVRKESWEPRHPQDFYRGKSREKQKGSERPEQEDVFLTTNQVQPEDL